MTPLAARAVPPEIAGKRAEVEHVLAEIRELDSSLEHSIEAYNGANVRLDQIEHEQARNRRYLTLARANLKREHTNLARRLVALYTSQEDGSTIGVLLGARSLRDVVDRLDTAERIQHADARIIDQVRRFKATVEAEKRRLGLVHGRQVELVAQRAEQKRVIEEKLGERRRLVESIKAEIVRLQAQERVRQARLAREARARLLAQQAAERAARANAAARAAAAAAAGSGSDGHVESAATSEADFGFRVVAPDATLGPPPARSSDVVSISMRYLGIPYLWGGASPSTGFDCSGLIMFVYAQIGISLPHYTVSQYQLGIPIPRDQLQPGDIVFFNGLGHNGMYIGGGQFIHAPHTGDVVKISSMSDAWYASSFVGARRIL